ncbi:hypothetical protein KK060_11570 [Fulvivirgaceae bacterium PWU20]|uniref:DoxX family protein n=1 Tax=Chryseosolibacter indicus TaxID=2782351 RepID=A0ABS5VT33_9BACT|nr:hypothetical protein [Chryseosolibacter indicus]
MQEAAHSNPAHKWKQWQLIAFRISFIFFISICIPNNFEWYKHVINIDWTNLHYRDLYDIARFGSGLNFFGNSIFGNTLLGYANWIITLIFSTVGGLLWTFIDQRRNPQPTEYNVLYYWLRAIVRYRAAIGIIGFGFTKLFPVQMPYPSYGLLNTDFGDFTAQKIYWLSIGIVPWYQVFAGVVEIGAGTLLFFRKTTLLGAALLFGALGDIVYVNFAYDGGVHVYSSYFVLLSAFLIVHYVPALYNLLILEQPAKVVSFYPSFSKAWQQGVRVSLKVATIAIFLVLFFYLQWINFLYDPYKQPSTKGVTALRGYYNVTEFKVNGKEIPYSPLDTTRWQEATFENWTTLTFKVNRPTPLDLSNGGGDPQRDINRTFELTGIAGGRRVFHYYADTVENMLYLQDKYKALPDRRNVVAGAGGDGPGNGSPAEKRVEIPENRKGGIYSDTWISKKAWSNIGEEVNFIDPRASSTRRNREFAEAGKKLDKRNRMVLQYQTDDGQRVILQGLNEDQDSLYVVLDKVDRQYILSKSDLVAGKY